MGKTFKEREKQYNAKGEEIGKEKKLMLSINGCQQKVGVCMISESLILE